MNPKQEIKSTLWIREEKANLNRNKRRWTKINERSIWFFKNKFNEN